MIPLLLDQGVPRDAASLLRQSHFECQHVGEIGMSQASDSEILAAASKMKAAVVTSPSSIRIRIQGMNAGTIREIVQSTVARFESELKRGCLLTVKSTKTTCHLLPIGGARE